VIFKQHTYTTYTTLIIIDCFDFPFKTAELVTDSGNFLLDKFKIFKENNS